MKINIQDLQDKATIPRSSITRLILGTLREEKVKKTGEISICFVTDKKIRHLNLKYLARDNPTDVMAFNLARAQDKNKISADIIISAERAIANARLFKTSIFYELCLYALHGLLHILGYNDRTLKARQLMHNKEKRILKRVLGI